MLIEKCAIWLQSVFFSCNRLKLAASFVRTQLLLLLLLEDFMPVSPPQKTLYQFQCLNSIVLKGILCRFCFYGSFNTFLSWFQTEL